MTTEIVATANQNVMVRPLVRSQDLIGYQMEVIDYIKRTLHEGVDYGSIPGTNSEVKVLKKPGAEILCKSAYLVPEYDILKETVDHDFSVKWEKKKYGKIETGEAQGLYIYVVRCKLSSATGQKVGEGIGSCSTMESKYITRPRDSENTVLKMAKKRAFVDATLTAFSLSGRFTQDVEDIKDNEDAGEIKTTAKKQSAIAPATQQTSEQVRLYVGDEQQQKTFKAHLETHGIAEEHWQQIHDAMLNQPKYKLDSVLAGLGLKKKGMVDHNAPAT